VTDEQQVPVTRPDAESREYLNEIAARICIFIPPRLNLQARTSDLAPAMPFGIISAACLDMHKTTLDNIRAPASELPAARKTRVTYFAMRHPRRSCGQISGGLISPRRATYTRVLPRRADRFRLRSCVLACSPSTRLREPRGALLIKKLIPRESDRQAKCHWSRARRLKRRKACGASFERARSRARELARNVIQLREDVTRRARLECS